MIDSRDQSRWDLASEAVEQALGRDRPYPCGANGHLDCSPTMHGPCSGARMARELPLVTDAEIDHYEGKYDHEDCPVCAEHLPGIHDEEVS
jgi:hypothetical protein